MNFNPSLKECIYTRKTTTYNSTFATMEKLQWEGGVKPDLKPFDRSIHFFPSISNGQKRLRFSLAKITKVLVVGIFFLLPYF